MLVDILCTQCGKPFSRQKKKVNKENNFCSRTCLANYQQELFSDEFTLVRYMLKNARKRARRDNIYFDLSLEILKSLWESQEGICALSGEPLVFGSTYNEKDSGFSTASLDRRDSGGGYTSDNIQIIHKKVNQMKMALSDPEFIHWCAKVADYQIRSQGLSGLPELLRLPFDSLGQCQYDRLASDETPF